MKRLLTVFLLALVPAAHAKLNVVATLPDFGVIAEAIGGDDVKVTTIARGTEDPHFVDARPSFIRVLNRADVLIEGGADLEIGWLPPLVNSARNSRILGNAPGHLVLARYIHLLEVPSGAVDRSMGDVHPGGNPHFWLDPGNGKIIAAKIAQTLSALNSKAAPDFERRLKEFTAKLDQKIPEWEKKLAPYKGTKIITYHKSYEYFAQRFGLVVFGQLEPKPGVEPTGPHVNELAQHAKPEGVKLLIIEPYRPRRTAQQVANAIGIPLLLLPEKTGALPEIKDYIGLFDYDVNKIAEALSGTSAPSPQ